MDLEQNRKTMNISEVEGDQPRLLSKENLLAELKLGDKKEINLNPSVPNNANKITPCTSPLLDSPLSGGLGLPIPKTIITKRTRTHSTNERAMKNPEVKGKIKDFSRTKGHGFIEHENGEDIFVHISDIEGEFVPKVGDEVTYRLCPIPPKEEKYQATHVRIINFTPDVHIKWDAPLYDEEKGGSDSCSSPME